MSDQGKAYVLTDEQRERLLMHARGWLAEARGLEDIGAMTGSVRLPSAGTACGRGAWARHTAICTQRGSRGGRCVC